jgi:hypothetical protein
MQPQRPAGTHGPADEPFRELGWPGALTPAGTLVLAGGEDGGRWTGMGRQLRALARSPFTRQRLTMLISRQRHADLETLARLIEAGGHARGKLVLTMTDAG